MKKDYVSSCKFINMVSVLLLCFCSSPLFFYGQSYNQCLVLLGVVTYGLSLRCVGTNIDHLVRVR